MTQKTCRRCGEQKSLSQFCGSARRRHSWCKRCLYDSQIARWKDRKRQAVALLGGRCQRCGYDRNLAAFCFHHRDALEKEFVWSRLRLRSWDAIVRELRKCTLLCANCHAEIHSPDETIIKPINAVRRRLDRAALLVTGRCPCGRPLHGTQFCSPECASNARRKVARPTRQRLLQALSLNSCDKLARTYGVTEAAIRKWASFYDITRAEISAYRQTQSS
jgi:hypothetical protein